MSSETEAPPFAQTARAEAVSSPDDDEIALPGPIRWKTNLALFVATVASVFFAGAEYAETLKHLPAHAGAGEVLRAVLGGYPYAVPLLAILLAHEFGHYFAARYHDVDASLPYFLPMPIISPFGTWGAVISMRGRIRSRDALLDIGASGPLAGLVVALPVLAYGLAHSPIILASSSGAQEGQSLLYLLMKRVVLGPIPPGHDVLLSPIAFAGWCGLFVTALNLLPVGQLDGGHVAYALFGPRQNGFARKLHASLLLVFAYNAAVFVVPVVRAHAWSRLDLAIGNSIFWLFWFGLLFVMRFFGGRDHPPTEPGELSPVRKVVAVVTLALFVLLFMPTPWAQY
jgi:membrane-associated protease RseP (regulator of RpoE activity)